MTRRCSHCSNNGHNSRTCPMRAGGVRLFGVRLTEGLVAMKKSASMGSLSSAHCTSFTAAASPTGGSPSADPHPAASASAASGYASDDPTHASCSSNCRSERKKGIPWTEEEHRMFLVGLRKLGKGDWRGIARNFVVSRTPTQVASHAQKYFIRQTNATRRKRRSSLFDMVSDMPVGQLPVLEEQFLLQSPPNEPENTKPSLQLSLDQESEPTEPLTNNPPLEEKENGLYNNFPPPTVPTFYPAYIPLPYSFWPPTLTPSAKGEVMGEIHEVLKPTPVLPKDPLNADELVGMSKLSIGEGITGRIEPSALSLKLLETSSSRQSAFHLNPSAAGSELSQSNSNAIHAV